MPPQTNITEKRSRIMVVPSHPAALSLTPTSLPKKLCRIFGHIFPKFSRIATTLHLFSTNGTSQHPYLTSPKNLCRIFGHIFPKFSRIAANEM